MTRRISRTTPNRSLTVGQQKEYAAGVKAVAVSMQRSLGHMGAKRSAQTLLKLNQADGFRLHELRLARPGGRAPAHRRILRERGQGGRRGGHHRPGDPGALRHPQHRGPGSAVGVVARPAGPDHRADGQAARRNALHTDRLGRGVRADRRRAERAGRAGRGHLLHLGPRLERERLRLPAFRAGVRHQQPARLLEHVPRVDERRVGRVDRHRQGIGQHRGRLQRAADHRGRAEPRHEPSADAVRAGDRQAQRRHHRVDQPAAGGRPGRLQEPAEPQGRGRRRHQAHRPAPAHQDQRGPRAVPGARVAAGAVGRDRPRLHRPLHHRVRRVEGARQRRRLGDGHRGDRSDPRRRSPNWRNCSARRRRRCSAGRWA